MSEENKTTAVNLLVPGVEDMTNDKLVYLQTSKEVRTVYESWCNSSLLPPEYVSDFNLFIYAVAEAKSIGMKVLEYIQNTYVVPERKDNVVVKKKLVGMYKITVHSMRSRGYKAITVDEPVFWPKERTPEGKRVFNPNPECGITIKDPHGCELGTAYLTLKDVLQAKSDGMYLYEYIVLRNSKSSELEVMRAWAGVLKNLKDLKIDTRPFENMNTYPWVKAPLDMLHHRTLDKAIKRYCPEVLTADTEEVGEALMEGRTRKTINIDRHEPTSEFDEAIAEEAENQPGTDSREDDTTVEENARNTEQRPSPGV